MFLTDQDEMSNLYRGPSIDASYQVSVHLAKQFQRRFFRNRPIKNKNCLWWPCLLTDRDKISKSYRGPFIDASYQVLFHLARRLQRIFFRNNQKQELPVADTFVNESGRYEQLLQRTFQVSVHLAKRFQRRRFFKSTNQKQELPVAAMFVNGSGRKVQSLQRNFHTCFQPSFSSFGQVVLEEKIKMCKSMMCDDEQVGC